MASQNAYAGPNLVTNGDFEQTTMPNGPTQMNTTNVTGWTTSGYNFIFNANAGTTGSYTPWYNHQVTLYGTAAGFTSPTGGNFIGADGAYAVGAITQTLNNLDVGGDYAVTFSWAAAQQQGYTGATTEQWLVSLGGQKQGTAVYSNPSHSLSGWMQQTMIFRATSTSEVLSFLAAGTPAGEPPFSLLDGVSATEVPEPATWGLLAIGMIGVAGLGMRQRARANRAV